VVRNGTNWLRAVSAFDRNACLLFITVGLLGFRRSRAQKARHFVPAL
jgi:hypothetical protein